MSITLLAAIGLAVLFPFVRTIAAVFMLVSLYSFMIAPVNSFADASTMTMLGDQQNMYGRVRVGGTIGWGVVAPVAGLVIERYGLNLAFWSYAIILFVGFLVSQRFVFSNVKQNVSIKHGMRELFSNQRMVLFLVTAFVTGMALMSINAFLAAYLSELGIKKSLLGFALAIATVAELPVLFFGDRLLAKLKPHGLLILSMFATMIRLFLYATVTSAIGVLVFQLINGFTSATLWVARVSYINEKAHLGLSVSMQ